VELAVHQVEGFGHAGFDGAFGDVEDLGDFAELEVLVMAQDQTVR
jgi:adenylate cyclase class IV